MSRNWKVKDRRKELRKEYVAPGIEIMNVIDQQHHREGDSTRIQESIRRSDNNLNLERYSCYNEG